MSGVFVAQTREQVRLLLDSNYAGLLSCLLTRESSASEIAGHTGQNLQQTHHKLTRLLQAGLIVQSGVQPRKGRPIKFYRAIADEYRIPFELTDAATLGELIQMEYSPLLRSHYAALSRAGGQDLRLFRCEDGMALKVDDEVKQARGISHSVFLNYRLSDEKARELEKRLQELAGWLSKASVGPAEEGKDYLLGLLLSEGRLNS